MTRIINVSKAPYEWQWDGGVYGPLQPGEIRDFPDPIAMHAIKRSGILDENGDPTGEQKVRLLSEVPAAEVRDIARYRCPMVESGQCASEVFETTDKLRDHMREHFRALARPDPGAAAPAPA